MNPLNSERLIDNKSNSYFIRRMLATLGWLIIGLMLGIADVYADIIPIHYGDSIQGSISTAEEEDTYSFVGQAGDEITLYFDNTTGSSFSARLVLRRPDGTVLKQTSYSSLDQEIGGLVLPVGGTYTVLVDGDGGDTGNYILYLSKLPPPIPISYGDSRSGTINLPGEEVAYSFSGQAETKATIYLETPGNLESMRLVLRGPDGSTLGATSYTSLNIEWKDQLLPVDGVYVILVDGHGLNTGNYTLRLKGPKLLPPGLNLIHPGPGPLTCQELLDSLGTPEEVDSLYRLDAPTQRFERCNPQAGVNFAIQLGEGYIVLMRKVWQTPIAPSPTCPEFNLSAGVNLIGHPKPPENLTCFGLLEALGMATVSTIQRYDTKAGRFESCTFAGTDNSNLRPAGRDFPIIAGEGYLLHLRMPGVVSLPGCGD